MPKQDNPSIDFSIQTKAQKMGIVLCGRCFEGISIQVL